MMQIAISGRPHLTYCTNIHPGETWPEVRDNLLRYVVAVRDQVAPGQRFGVGLRLSAAAAEALAEPAAFADLAKLLAEHDLYVFTINGFPYGRFHGARVKERVYLPDWLDPERLRYTDRLARLLARLLPAADLAIEGSVSTVPGAFRARVRSDADAARMADAMLRHAVTLHDIRERTGKRIALALEPEPCCYLETMAEAVAFFERHLLSRAAIARMRRETGMGAGRAEAFLRHHLGVCVDACHLAVAFEDPPAALARLRAAGIRICKIQLSAGLEVRDPRDARVRAALRPFAEDVYLHQVFQRRGNRLWRARDLPAALAALDRDRGQAGAGPWRIHFHVPVFLHELGCFRSTQPALARLLRAIARDAPCSHLEVETYTWDVLPEAYRRGGVVPAVARELRWVMDVLAEEGK